MEQKGSSIIHSDRFKLAAIAIICFFAVLALPFSVFLLQGKYFPFWFLTGDAYLYLGIGQKSRFWYFTFDGSYPTNGFHPLWQYVVTLAAFAGRGDQLQYMTYVVWSSIACICIGASLLGCAIFIFTRSMLLSIMVVPGLYYFLIGQSFANMHIWNFVDGMESGISILLIGLLAFVVACFIPRRMEHNAFDQDSIKFLPPITLFGILGFIFALILLARLDEIFLLASFVASVLLIPTYTFRKKILAILLLSMPAGIVLAAYMLHNYSYAGSLLPVSGLAKGEGGFLSNAWVSIVTFFSPTMDIREAIWNYRGNREALSGASFRVIELIVPALISLSVLLTTRRASWGPYYFFIFALCVGTILKASYNFLFVNFWHQSAWYFATECCIVSILIALALRPLISRLTCSASAVLWVSYVLFYLITFSKTYSDVLLSSRQEYLSFWNDREIVERAIRSESADNKIIEFGDGFLNFTLNIPTMHGFAFAGDIRSLRALQSGSLLQLASRRGFDVISSFDYLPWTSVDDSSDAIRSYLRNSFLDERVKAELDDFEYQLIYVYEPLKVPFIKFRPKNGGH